MFSTCSNICMWCSELMPTQPCSTLQGNSCQLKYTMHTGCIVCHHQHASTAATNIYSHCMIHLVADVTGISPSLPIYHRHSDAHLRPKFSELLNYLKSLSTPELLQWSQEDLNAAAADLPQATEIGAPLETGRKLFKDLQDTYKQATPYS